MSYLGLFTFILNELFYKSEEPQRTDSKMERDRHIQVQLEMISVLIIRGLSYHVPIRSALTTHYPRRDQISDLQSHLIS